MTPSPVCGPGVARPNPAAPDAVRTPCPSFRLRLSAHAPLLPLASALQTDAPRGARFVPILTAYVNVNIAATTLIVWIALARLRAFLVCSVCARYAVFLGRCSGCTVCCTDRPSADEFVATCTQRAISCLNLPLLQNESSWLWNNVISTHTAASPQVAERKQKTSFREIMSVRLPANVNTYVPSKKKTP